MKIFKLAKEANKNEQRTKTVQYYESLKYLFPATNQQTLTLCYKFWRSVARLCDLYSPQRERIRENAEIPKKLDD